MTRVTVAKVKKETPPVDEMRARMSHRKSAAQKGKNATGSADADDLDANSLVTHHGASSITPQPQKRERVEESSFELVLPDSLSLQKDPLLATQIGVALNTQTDLDYIKAHTYLALY